MNKGDFVRVKRSVYTKKRVARQCNPKDKEEVIREIESKFGSRGYPRPLMGVIHKKPIKGIVVGWSTRLSGVYWPGKTSRDLYGDQYEPGEIDVHEVHKVVMVQPIDTIRWVEPLPCLEEDLEKLKYPIVRARRKTNDQ